MDTKQIPVTIIAGIVRALGELETSNLHEIASILREFTSHQALAEKIDLLAKAKEVIEKLESNY